MSSPARRTKIVATVGPASREPGVLEQMVRAGVNVFRLNLSHGDHDEHRVYYEHIRAAADAAGEPVAVLADLCGPKVRAGRFAGGQVALKAGEKVTVTTKDVLGGPGLIPTQYPALPRDVRPGDRILLDDGLLELRVDPAGGDEVSCTVTRGGVLRDRKGMNLPGVAVSSPALTDKDRADTRFVVGLGVDLLALSFVRRAEDVLDLKALLRAEGRPTPVIAKIEKPEVLGEIGEVLDSSDGLMVARGDLGVEMPPEAVPIVQRDLVGRARHRGRPVIVATQMLESMVEHPRPTRAEVSDVSTAVFGGADAVMLSAETSVGAYPVLAVEMMDRVARAVESWQSAQGFRTLAEDDHERAHPPPPRVAVARCAARLRRELGVRAVVVRTRNGTSAAMVASTRPSAPVVALTADPAAQRRLALLWGVVPRLVDPGDLGEPHESARKAARALGLAGEGDVILLLAGFGRREPSVTALTV
jgi:pyruvate kinase